MFALPSPVVLSVDSTSTSNNVIDYLVEENRVPGEFVFMPLSAFGTTHDSVSANYSVRIWPPCIPAFLSAAFHTMTRECHVRCSTPGKRLASVPNPSPCKRASDPSTHDESCQSAVQ